MGQLGSGIAAEPRLPATVEIAADDPSCPSDLVSVAERGGDIDVDSIRWTDTSAQHSAPSTRWGFDGDFTVAFTSSGGERREMRRTRIQTEVLLDAQGDPVLKILR